MSVLRCRFDNCEQFEVRIVQIGKVILKRRVCIEVVYIWRISLSNLYYSFPIIIYIHNFRINNISKHLFPYFPTIHLQSLLQQSIILILYIYSSMFRSSSSSRFEKDLYSTQGFDLESQLGQANFSLAQSIDEFDLQQSCLIRLKAQRQKIEELTKLYQDNEKELARRAEKQRAMQAEIEQLTDMAAFKGEWQALKRQYEALFKRNQAMEGEMIALKKEFQGVATNSCDESEQLRKQIKYLKEQRLLSDAHWEGIMYDKEEHLKKECRRAQEKEYELCQKIRVLSQKVQTLEEALYERQHQFASKGQQFRQELTVREEDLMAFEKVVESFKKQNNEYKAKIISMQESFNKQKEQYLEAIDQLKAQVKIFRKDQTEKQNEIYQFKEIIKKCDSKNQALESTVTSLKSNLKKIKVNSDTNIKKMTSVSEEQRGKMELFIHELKSELQRQIQENAGLYVQLKRVKGQLQRKDHQQKQRKLLLMSEFRQIDKMERMVKKII